MNIINTICKHACHLEYFLGYSLCITVVVLTASMASCNCVSLSIISGKQKKKKCKVTVFE